MRRFPLLVGFVLNAVAVVRGAPAASDAGRIAIIREASNAAIAAHNATEVASFLMEDVRLTAGNGMAWDGRHTVREKFASQFRKYADILYVRTPSRIVVSASAPRAAEHGTWTGRWTVRGKLVEVRGDYLAMWRKVAGAWLIRTELFVILERREDGLLVQEK